MDLTLKEDFPLALNVKNMTLVITSLYSGPDGTPMADIALDIISKERFDVIKRPLLDESGQEAGYEFVLGEKVLLNSPYHLERVNSIPNVPFSLVCAVVDASNNEEILPGVNYAIKQAEFDKMFTGSLSGLKLDIEKVEL